MTTLLRTRTTADHWLDGRGDMTALVPLRIVAGIAVLLHLRPFLDSAAAGVTWDERFHVLYADWYPAIGGTAYAVALWIAVAAAVMLSVGLFTRSAAAVVAVLIAWNLFLSTTHFHHNRAYLTAILVGIALLPVGRVGSLDAVIRRWRGLPRLGPIGPLWPLLLMRFEASVIYTASGLSKVIDGDWWSGLVLRLRIEEHADLAASRGVPDWVMDTLANATVMGWLAKVIVLTEVFIGLGLLFRKTRPAAIWCAIAFHITIQATAQVQVFSLIGLAALIIWVTPSSRDRTLILDPADRNATRLGRAVALLDWLGRFRIEWESGADPVTLVDRPGSDDPGEVLTGRTATLVVLSRLPAAFWPVAPFAAMSRWRARRRVTREPDASTRSTRR